MRYSERDVSAFQKAEPAPTTQEQKNESNTGQEIWEKYRALVGGEETKKESPKDGTIPVKDIPKPAAAKSRSLPSPRKRGSHAIKPTDPRMRGEGNRNSAKGLGGILQQYRNQQKSRHQMRSLQIHKAKPAQEAAE